MYEYIIYTQNRYDKDGEVVEKGEILVAPTHVLVASERDANTVASRAIPDKYMDELDRVSVVVRPF
jgi:coenzyme F420-reducing hydrogenase alpha subunit